MWGILYKETKIKGGRQMKNKKLWAALLVSAMTMTAAMGTGVSASETEGTSGEREKDGIMYTEGLPIVDDGDYTFSLFVDGGVETDEPTMMPILKEQTGVNVDLQAFAYEIATEKYSLEFRRLCRLYWWLVFELKGHFKLWCGYGCICSVGRVFRKVLPENF
jgi:hypothetical protein